MDGKECSGPTLKELSETLKKELGQNIEDIILFGSRAIVILSEAKNLKTRPFATLRVTTSWQSKFQLGVVRGKFPLHGFIHFYKR
ncbi:MAG TPA: hypothetical protein ACFYD3_01110 [Candidatus Hypogeohydataceae bacterium YC41]